MDCLNELMDISPVDSYFEEGEIESNEDEEDNEDYKCSTDSILRTKHAKEKPLEKSRISFNSLESDEEMKKLNRSKKFSFWAEDAEKNKNYQLINLYKDLGIDKENERHYRFNVIHMRGTEDMSTDDVLDYFELYAPLNIEWVNDCSCNIVWSDDISAAKALLGLSKKIKSSEHLHDPFQNKSSNGIHSSELDEGVDAKSIKITIPPGSWRLGKPDKKCPYPLLRYATWSDKKQKLFEKNNVSNKLKSGWELQLKTKGFSHPVNYKKENVSWNKNNDLNTQSKVISNPWADLAFEWGKTDKVENISYSHIEPKKEKSSLLAHSNVQDLRLSLKNNRNKQKRLYERIFEPDRQDYPEDWEIKSKIPRMKMYADEEERKLKNSSGNYSVIVKPVEDLRSKINRKKKGKRLNLRIEKQIELHGASSESSNDEYENEASGTWALEQYEDLRETLRQNNRFHKERCNIMRSAQGESESDSLDNCDDFYVRNLRQRSPLQIEIDNDEYYENKSNKR